MRAARSANLAATALVLLVSAGAPAPDRMTVITPDGVALGVETVAASLETVWDMTWGPDGQIWITERSGRISRVHVGTGEVTLVGELSVAEVSESGLMGLALHPDFPDEPWVYAVHSYRAGDDDIRNRLVRMRYVGDRLGAPETLIDGIAGNGNHNGARLAVGPDRLLYMSMGDAGERSRAQDRSSLNGKILRLTLDGDPAPGNPFDDEVWSWGHRNPQGLAFQPGTNVLYAVEHGPSTDDEVNRIERGRNYGWPLVRGFCDTPEEAEFCAGNDIVEPVEAWTPTVGTAGADFYDSDVIPGWRGSLLVTALRGESLFRITLTPDGHQAASTERLFEGELGRLRDVLVAPDGAVYLATSNRDGRGDPAEDDDRIVRVTPEVP